MNVTFLQPDGLVLSPAFSHVAIVPAGAATIYVGGQNGVDASGQLVSRNVVEQAQRAVENAIVALAAAGVTPSDVVQWTVFIAADADLGAAYQAIAPRISRDGLPPLVLSARVSAFGVPDALIEVSAIAALVTPTNVS